MCLGTVDKLYTILNSVLGVKPCTCVVDVTHLCLGTVKPV